MKKIAFFSVLSLALWGCSSDVATQQKDGTQTEQEQEVNVVADRVMTVEVEGMVCQMGCGGEIRKQLKATKAVASCEFDFEEERKMDVVTIKYDSKKITEAQIKKTIAETNDGQFTVGKASTEELLDVSTNESSETSGSSSNVVESSTGPVGLPNLLDLLSGLLL